MVGDGEELVRGGWVGLWEGVVIVGNGVVVVVMMIGLVIHGVCFIWLVRKELCANKLGEPFLVDNGVVFWSIP